MTKLSMDTFSFCSMSCTLLRKGWRCRREYLVRVGWGGEGCDGCGQGVLGVWQWCGRKEQNYRQGWVG